MTKGEAIELMLRWLDEATVNGQNAQEEQIADLRDRGAWLLDGVLKFLAEMFPFREELEIVWHRQRNLLGDGFAKPAYHHSGDFTLQIPQMHSLYVEVSGKGACVTLGDKEETIEDNAYHVFKFSNTGEATALRVDSSFPFSIRNAALYEAVYPTDDDVPAYTRYVPHKLPENFRKLVSVTVTDEHGEHQQSADYHLDGVRTVMLPYAREGRYRIRYERNPDTVPYDAPDDTELEFPAHAEQLIPLKLAVDLCKGVDDTQSIAYYLDSHFQMMVQNLMNEAPDDTLRIESVYTGGW